MTNKKKNPTNSKPSKQALVFNMQNDPTLADDVNDVYICVDQGDHQIVPEFATIHVRRADFPTKETAKITLE